MYICVCKAVSDKHIRHAVREGACSMRQLTRGLGVATVCGKCVPAAREVLNEALADQAPVMSLEALLGGGAASGSAQAA